MNRVFIVARSEFLTIVRGKAFIIGVLMVPVLVAASIVFQIFAERRADVADHRLAVIDRTGVLYETLVQAAAEHDAAGVRDGQRTGPRFLLERADTARPAADLAVELSDRVRSRDLFAFVEIPETILDPSRVDDDELRYFTETPSYGTLRDWLRTTIEREVTQRRFSSAAIDAAVVDRLSRGTDVATLGLISRAADGTVAEARRTSEVETVVIPFALMYLMFLALMSAAPQLLTAVVEEKMSRVSEVLISSIPPFHLMAGKLLGVSAVAVVLALAYLAGGLYLAISTGNVALVRLPVLFGFIGFLIVAVLMFGAVFIAIGAMCSDLKDSQSLMQPAVFFLMLPLIAAPVLLRAPDSTLSVVLSLVPFFSPFLMLVRLALTPPPPLWQVLLALAMTGATAALIIWMAGRIFRVGLLMQGKPPNLPELLRWIRQ